MTKEERLELDVLRTAWCKPYFGNATIDSTKQMGGVIMTKEECLELELDILRTASSRYLVKLGLEQYLVDQLFIGIHDAVWTQYEEAVK